MKSYEHVAQPPSGLLLAQGTDDRHMNLAGFFPATSCMGPGRRAILWCQGCLQRCPGCINPHMQPLRPRTLVAVEDLVAAIDAIEGLEGITVVGGEPLLQAAALAALLRCLRGEQGLGTMIYSGYTLAQLIATHDRNIDAVLRHTDILVDGPYIAELDQSQMWRGSANQKIHFLSQRYQNWHRAETCTQRAMELHVDTNGTFLALGIPSPDFFSRLASQPGVTLEPETEALFPGSIDASSNAVRCTFKPHTKDNS
ncbi:MAG: hypothetical protein BWK76_08155 [Desulfobulbaceae bacterium A2]|nr:MAG: hypothetical protein BWK76_08155 [Desulfobulbaceae bacterium A2]